MSDADHDVLIKLVGAVAELKESTNEKFADLKSDIKELKDGHSMTIADHENRIRALEKSSEDLQTVKKIVYGAVAFILVSVLGAITLLVIKK